MLRYLAKKIPPIVRLHKIHKAAQNYLAPLGYFNDTPTDSAGNALPFYTYPAIHFLDGIIQPHWKIFEYGCGYSTVFWNTRCTKTVSVEHNAEWFNLLKERNKHFEIHLVEEGADWQKQEVVFLKDAFEANNFCIPRSPNNAHNKEHGLLDSEFLNYVAKLMDFPKGFFDVIVVDGMARSLCLLLAADYVSPGGIIILDDSQRWQYNDAQDYLIRGKGFDRLDFHGLGPVDKYAWTTSIFFRNTDFLKHCESKREKGGGDLGW